MELNEEDIKQRARLIEVCKGAPRRVQEVASLIALTFMTAESISKNDSDLRARLRIRLEDTAESFREAAKSLERLLEALEKDNG